MVALTMLPNPLLHSPGTPVVVPFCQVMLLDIVGPEVYDSIVIGCAEYPLVQLKVKVAFMNTWFMSQIGVPVMLAVYPVASEVPCGWITLIYIRSEFACARLWTDCPYIASIVIGALLSGCER